MDDLVAPFKEDDDEPASEAESLQRDETEMKALKAAMNHFVAGLPPLPKNGK